jgi:hypothetical protein
MQPVGHTSSSSIQPKVQENNGELAGRKVSCWSKFKNFLTSNQENLLTAMFITGMALLILSPLGALLSSTLGITAGATGIGLAAISQIVACFISSNESEEEQSPEQIDTATKESNPSQETDEKENDDEKGLQRPKTPPQTPTPPKIRQKSILKSSPNYLSPIEAKSPSPQKPDKRRVSLGHTLTRTFDGNKAPIRIADSKNDVKIDIPARRPSDSSTPESATSPSTPTSPPSAPPPARARNNSLPANGLGSRKAK